MNKSSIMFCRSIISVIIAVFCLIGAASVNAMEPRDDAYDVSRYGVFIFSKSIKKRKFVDHRADDSVSFGKDLPYGVNEEVVKAIIGEKLYKDIEVIEIDDLESYGDIKEQMKDKKLGYAMLHIKDPSVVGLVIGWEEKDTNKEHFQVLIVMSIDKNKPFVRNWYNALDSWDDTFINIHSINIPSEGRFSGFVGKQLAFPEGIPYVKEMIFIPEVSVEDDFRKECMEAWTTRCGMTRLANSYKEFSCEGMVCERNRKKLETLFIEGKEVKSEGGIVAVPLDYSAVPAKVTKIKKLGKSLAKKLRLFKLFRFRS